MPLVAHTDLPAYQRLRDEGFQVLSPEQTIATGIPSLHIGMLNLMPDAALQATERQFLRLLSAGRKMVYVYVHLFTVDGVGRQGPANAHVESCYEDFEDIKRCGLDALLVTGANPANPVLSEEGFWPAMIEVLDWGRDHVSSIMCSCLATHAVVQHHHGAERTKLPEKRWGVYSHRLLSTDHPLVNGVNSRFDAPHSHVYEVTEEQLTAHNIRVLAISEEAGVHLAVSEDNFKFIFFQGHPEYDSFSLLKEYKREVMRFSNGVRNDYAEFPRHYFTQAASERLSEYRRQMLQSDDPECFFQRFSELEFGLEIENTWTDTGMAMFGKWIDLVHGVSERTGVYRPGIDPRDPLGLVAG
jgi:homoserine O-succinyltransferase